MQLELFDDLSSGRGEPSTAASDSSPRTDPLLIPLSTATKGWAPAPSPQTRHNGDRALFRIWHQIRAIWFPQRFDLDAYAVNWSTRSQKRTLASCNLSEKRVIVARELNYQQHRQWLEPLLYHEMCHAALNSRFHDRRFYALERRHPGISLFDHWINTGGWQQAVRSDRAKRAYQRRLMQSS